MIENIFILIFFLLTLNYSYFLLFVFKGLTKLFNQHKEENIRNNKKVSVIIPFRNESDNLLTSLKSMHSQTYSTDLLEVIYVNDNSDDDSLNKILTENKSKNIKILTVPNEYSPNSHKKRAVSFGIKNSTGEIIISTDADCSHNKKWVETIVQQFNENTGFVSGPVYFNNSNSIFQKLQQIEFAGLVIVGAGLIGNNYPKICNAANCAYLRDAFNKVDGFEDSFHLSSGDDELLMQKIARNTDYKIKFVTDKNSIVYTDANKTLNDFFRQRKRWASKGFFYSDNIFIIKLILIYFYYLFLALSFFIGIFFSIKIFYAFLTIFIIKNLLEYLVVNKGMKIFNEKINNLIFILGEIFHVPYILIAGLSGSFGNYTWKERKVKR